MHPVNLHPTPATEQRNSAGEITENTYPGSFRGEPVHLRFGQSSRIEDAAEELTFTIAEESEKSLARREIRIEGGKSRQIERIGQIEELAQLQEMQRKLPDLDAGKLARLRERLRQLSHRDGQRCLDEAERFFSDPSLQYAAFALLEQEADDPGMARDLRDAQAVLLERQGSAVRAGLNVSAVAAGHAAPAMGDLSKLRADYREVALNTPGVTKLYDTLLEKYGRAGLTDGIRYLLAALAADLGADRPSIERWRLQATLSAMTRLETLSTLLEHGDHILARFAGRGLAEDYDSRALVGDLLGFLEKSWLQPQQVEAVTVKAGMQHTQDRIDFLREMTALARQAPLSVYADPEQRDRLLAALQDGLDRAIAEE